MTQSPTTPHTHKGNQCPVTGKHGWCPAQQGDSRSPCPALNAMANHGYISRDGHNISVFDLIRGLRHCYSLSFALSVVLAVGGFFLLKRLRPISLYHVGKHNAIEHNASLVHADNPDGQKYAPTEVVPGLVDALLNDAKSSYEEGSDAGDSVLIDATDIARSRVRREKECSPVDGLHAEIARGEMAIVLGMWETKTKNNSGVPAEWLKQWMQEERLPEEWKPTHVQGLLDVMRRSKLIRKSMELLQSDSSSSSSASSDSTLVQQKP
ncbi:hypothetical protein AX17_001970 [Amanita inopinata Kibby_2008]|nr:hypothetical protein AX17_001970 [Amanita inopinata Kibby_2008]